MQFTPFSSSVFIQIPKYSLNFTVVTYFLHSLLKIAFSVETHKFFLLFSKTSTKPTLKMPAASLIMNRL